VRDEGQQSLIKGGIQTLSRLVPGVGGAFAQAWSEYETLHQSKRISEFFDQFTKRMQAMEMQQIRAAATRHNKEESAVIEII
jgi:hypothetical protein